MGSQSLLTLTYNDDEKGPASNASGPRKGKSMEKEEKITSEGIEGVPVRNGGPEAQVCGHADPNFTDSTNHVACSSGNIVSELECSPETSNGSALNAEHPFSEAVSPLNSKSGGAQVLIEAKESPEKHKPESAAGPVPLEQNEDPSLVLSLDNNEIGELLVTPESTEALRQFNSEYLRDREEFAALEQILKACDLLCNDLSRRAMVLKIAFGKVVEKTRKIVDSEEIPTQVKKTIENSFSGLELILKMVDRLPERMPKPDSANRPHVDDLQQPQPADGLLEIDQLKSRLKEMGLKNYKQLITMKRLTEDARDSFFSFFRTRVVAVLDGIHAGKQHFGAVKDSLLNSQGCQTQIVKWVGIYDWLDRVSNTLILKKLQVEIIEPEKGNLVDYELHEPFDVVEGDQDETVHEVIRVGYRYTGPLYEGLKHVIRPAQVIVTKSRKVS